MTDVGNENALSHPLPVPEEPLEPVEPSEPSEPSETSGPLEPLKSLEPLEPTIKFSQKEDTISIDIEQKEQSPLLGI